MADLDSLINLFNNRKYEQIITEYKSSSFSLSSNPAESRILAAAYFSIGQYDNAYSILNDLTSIFVGDVDFLSLLGATARRLQKYTEAKSAFDEALKIQPANPELLNNYSNLLIDMGELKEAVKLLSSLSEANPNYSDAVQNLQRAKYMLQNSQTGGQPPLKVASQSTTTTNSVSSLKNPIELAFSKEESDRSRKDHLDKFNATDKEFLNSVPNTDTSCLDSESLSFIQQCIESKDYNQALRLLDKASLNLPVLPGRLYKLASDCYLGLAKYPEAESCLMHALLLDGPSSDYFVNLASFSLVSDNLKMADYYLGKAASYGASDDLTSKIQNSINSKKANSTSSFKFSTYFKNNAVLSST